MHELARLRIPDVAEHVVGHTGHQTAVARRRHAAHPFRVRIDFADEFASLDVPPDQFAVVGPRHDKWPGERDAGDVAFVTGQLLPLRLLRSHVYRIHLRVGTPGEHATCPRQARDAEEDAGVIDLLGDFQLAWIGWHV